MENCSTTPANKPLATHDTYGLVKHDLSPTPELATSPTRGPGQTIATSSSSPSLATSEADPNVSYCVLCDKSYTGPNARSILRRHKSEKHGIALSEQRKGTRWDKDPNRPRSEAERRERTLESKRRYAQRRRRQLQEAQDALKAAHGIDLIHDTELNSDPFAHEELLASRARMFTDTTTPKNARFLPSTQDTPAAPLAPITNVRPPTTPKKSKTDLYKLLNSPLPVTPDSSPIHQLHLPKLPFLSSSPGQENNMMMMPRLRSSSRNSPRNNSLGRKAPPSSPLAGFNPYPSRQTRDTVDAAAWSLLALHKTSDE